jgi:hypothetical protein
VDRRRLLHLAVSAAAVLLVVLAVSRLTTSSEADHGPSVDGGTAAEAIEAHSARPWADVDDAPDIGFPRTREGAVAAATAYALALDNPRILDPDHRAQVLDDVAAEASLTELRAVFDEGLALISSQLHLDAEMSDDLDFVWRAVPGGWRVVAFDRSAATVAVWSAVMAIADGRLLAEPGWRTTEVALVWEREAWRLVGFQTGPGPDPARAQVEAGSVARQINAFAPYRHWPDTQRPETGR